MMSEVAVRFWQPAPQEGTDLVCAYLEAGRARAHLHEEWQFAVPESPAKLSVGAFRRYTVHPADLTIIPPYHVHTEGGGPEPTPNWRVLYVAPALLGRVRLGSSGISAHEVSRPLVPILPDPPAANELRGLLGASERGDIDGPEFLVRALRWLEQLLDRHAAEVAIPTRVPAVERARRYLEDRATHPVSLSEVGAVAGVTVSHLVRSFSRTVGLPPKSYHAQVRLARARRLLAQGKSATWVAYECGFADQSHLSRRFKECYGLTPGAFQDQYHSPSRSPARLAGVASNAA